MTLTNPVVSNMSHSSIYKYVWQDSIITLFIQTHALLQRSEPSPTTLLRCQKRQINTLLKPYADRLWKMEQTCHYVNQSTQIL